MRDDILPGLQQVAVRVQVERHQQSIHGLSMRFEVSIGQDVSDGDARFVEHASDQQRPVAVQRFLFGAHERDATFSGPADNPRDTVAKAARASHAFIGDTTSLVAFGIVRSGPHVGYGAHPMFRQQRQKPPSE